MSELQNNNAFQQAIDEIAEGADVRNKGLKNQVCCPDCMAILLVHLKEDGRFDLEFVKHQT